MPKAKDARGRWKAGGGGGTSGGRSASPAKARSKANAQLRKQLDSANRKAETRAKKVGPQLQRRTGRR